MEKKEKKTYSGGREVEAEEGRVKKEEEQKKGNGKEYHMHALQAISYTRERRQHGIGYIIAS